MEGMTKLLRMRAVMNSKTCIIIAGPTAVGKTALAIALAQHFQTEIISADSRQCYTELTIGVAKPSTEELLAVPHHFINSHSIRDEVSAADFATYASAAAQQIFEHHDIAVMVGGTGLYIRAFCQGMDSIPAIDAALRISIREQYAAKGMEWLQQAVAQKDPGYFATGEIQNPQRMMRALEVILQTGISIMEYQRGGKVQRDFNIIQFGLELPRDVLYDRINRRADEMMKAGLEAEAKGLWPYKYYNALQTVGYRELFAHFEGEYSSERAVELIKQHTRHYAKRQMTWFKKDTAITWLHPDPAFAHIVAKAEEIRNTPA